MARERAKKDFTGFILAAEKSDRLTKEFFSKKKAEDLKEFFDAEGFTEIELSHCKNIIRVKNPKDRPPLTARKTCPSGTHY